MVYTVDEVITTLLQPRICIVRSHKSLLQPKPEFAFFSVFSIFTSKKGNKVTLSSKYI